MPAEASNSETEFALAICAVRPWALADEIAGLSALAGYRLVSPKELLLHDVYWDLPSRALGKQRIGLRLRSSDGQVWLTLKGPAMSSDGGVPRRMEREAPWSREALTAILANLRTAGLSINEPSPEAKLGSPRDTLHGLGLEIVQDRTTRRRARNVVGDPAGGGPVLAELAIDSTRYQMDGLAVTHDEIEIEVKSEGGSVAVDLLVAALRDRYGPDLRPWNHGKLPTGSAIQALHRASSLGNLVGERGALTAKAYDLLEAELRHGV